MGNPVAGIPTSIVVREHSEQIEMAEKSMLFHFGQRIQGSDLADARDLHNVVPECGIPEGPYQTVVPRMESVKPIVDQSNLDQTKSVDGIRKAPQMISESVPVYEAHCSGGSMLRQ